MPQRWSVVDPARLITRKRNSLYGSHAAVQWFAAWTGCKIVCCYRSVAGFEGALMHASGVFVSVSFIPSHAAPHWSTAPCGPSGCLLTIK